MNQCGFQSFFFGGFECSSHKQENGRRLDLIKTTGHERFCEADYSRLRESGIHTARDGIRWHLIETKPGNYDFSSFLPMLEAARRTGMQVIWDVMHYGWPDDIDVFSPEFIHRFGAFASAVAQCVRENSSEAPNFVPINEMSFLAWAGGDVAALNPFAIGRGHELKIQLVKANKIAVSAIRSVIPAARFMQVDPAISIVTLPSMSEEEKKAADGHDRSQYEAWDLLSEETSSDALHGRGGVMDVVGVNYYIHNQWVYGAKFIERTDPRYRPLREIIKGIHLRYQRPLVIAETGTEDELRPEWFRYVCDEAAAAIESGVPLEGICLYPITSYPGWQDDRLCHAGLWGCCDEGGRRDVYTPLADELEWQQARFRELTAAREASAVGAVSSGLKARSITG